MAGYISEVDYDGGADSNFVEIVMPAGTDTSAYSLLIYDKNGMVISTLSLGTVVTTIAGQDVYLIDSTDPGFVDIHNNEALALVDDTGSVVQFIGFKTAVTAAEGAASGMTSTLIGEHSGAEQSLATTNGGTTYAPESASTPGAVPCYGPGTLIQTADGPRAVEALRVGDLVDTADAGPQPVVWTSHRKVGFTGRTEHDRPIRIGRGALGNNLPVRDIVVSAQHRMLVGGMGQLADAFDAECFVPARALLGLPGVRVMQGRRAITWHHFALRRHHVVQAEGCLTESLLLGRMVLGGLPSAQRRRVALMFGCAAHGRLAGQDMLDAVNGPLARPCLSVGEARQQLDQWARTAPGRAGYLPARDLAAIMMMSGFIRRAA